MLLPKRCAWALAAECLVTPTLGFAASCRLILSCEGRGTASEGKGAGRPVDGAMLIFDFDRGLVFHDRATEGISIRTIKRSLITWESDDGTRTDYLNRVTLEAGETRRHS